MTTHIAVWLDHKEARVFTFHLDHPTDGQIVAYAKKYFRRADRMR
jgi:hypothetical protein